MAERPLCCGLSLAGGLQACGGPQAFIVALPGGQQDSLAPAYVLGNPSRSPGWVGGANLFGVMDYRVPHCESLSPE